MIYGLIRKKSFDRAKFLGEYWLVIVEATQLFCFKERHCKHCLTKTFNKSTPEEKTVYYHQVLEAKVVLSDSLIISIAIFKQAGESVRGGIIIGLGSRLQVFQNKLIRHITSHDKIDLTLPGREKCAYFCITSDQDSTFDFLSSLFLSFLFIKLALRR